MTRASDFPTSGGGNFAETFCTPPDGILAADFTAGLAAALTAIVEGSFAEGLKWVLAANRDASLAADGAEALRETVAAGFVEFREGFFAPALSARFVTGRAAVRLDE